jgi:phage repressor protein C with HTH and peptisase S24 domain
MIKDVERKEREERAARLKQARQLAGLKGPKDVAAKHGFNENNYKAHEAGRNGFSPALAEEYAAAFGVSKKWLYLNIGAPDDKEEDNTIHVIPLLSMVSAGLLSRDDVADEAMGTLRISDLPPGDWIALRVLGDSMDRISPPESVILVDRRDKRLVPNALYVIADEEGNSTYKRYRPGPPPRFEPVSTNTSLEPIFPHQEPVIVGRVRRTILDT